MTTLKCRECGKHWSEGPTRDYREDCVCRRCLQGAIQAYQEGPTPENLEKLFTVAKT